MEKIKRYDPPFTANVGFVQMVPDTEGMYVEYDDHESALAEAQAALAAKDARIAELERERKDVKFTCSVLRLSRGHVRRKLKSLRAAIEAKAREWVEKANNDLTRMRAEGVYDCAAEIRALLEEGK